MPANAAAHGSQAGWVWSQRAELARHAEAGSIRPVVDALRPLDEIADAHRELEAGGVQGEHVLHLTWTPRR
ncbi:zinc-binding dehydrogenase [Saccharopolyspora sp. NPDC049357]|uniref:zinc-binding dehydrogenase n=1 Tax=Saccharopolyspora sp. NPDC049357 TaxID=3154507 RepID=UPI003448FAE0